MKKARLSGMAALMLTAQICLSGCQSADSGFRKAGNVVTFGRYEQDNDTENGQEPIGLCRIMTGRKTKRCC